MDEEPGADDEDEHGGVGNTLEQHPDSNAQVQSSEEKEGGGARRSADEEKLKEGCCSTHHQQPRDQLIQRQALEEEGHQNSNQTHDAEHHAIDGIVQGQPLQVLFSHLCKTKKTYSWIHETKWNLDQGI